MAKYYIKFEQAGKVDVLHDDRADVAWDRFFKKWPKQPADSTSDEWDEFAQDHTYAIGYSQRDAGFKTEGYFIGVWDANGNTRA